MLLISVIENLKLVLLELSEECLCNVTIRPREREREIVSRREFERYVSNVLRESRPREVPNIEHKLRVLDDKEVARCIEMENTLNVLR